MKETFEEKIKRLEKKFGPFLKYQPSTKWLLFENGIVDPDENITLKSTDKIKELITNEVKGSRILILTLEQVNKIINNQNADRICGLSADILALPETFKEEIDEEKFDILKGVLARSEEKEIIFY